RGEARKNASARCVPTATGPVAERTQPTSQALSATPGWGAELEGSGPPAPLDHNRPARSSRTSLNVVIEKELVRRGAHPDRIEFLVAFELEPLVDRVLREHVALDQELVVLLDGVERLFKAARHVRDVFELLGRKTVDVLVHRIARVDLVLDPVDTGHQHRAEREVRVAARVRETDLHAAGLRVRSRDRD